MRPVLVPSARRLWRDNATLQLGRPSSRAQLVQGLTPERRALLPLLDGSRTREQVVAQALASGCPDADEVLAVLEDGGLVLDADDLSPQGLDRTERERLGPDLASLALTRGRRAARALLARRSARVVVHGGGRVGGPLAALLAAAGVGTVDVRDAAPTRAADTAVGGLEVTDLGRPREEAMSARLRSLGSARPPALVVLADDGAAGTAASLGRAGTPHLLAFVEEARGVVGPLVLPGSSPCVGCLELVRTALDPDWPALATQADRGPRATPACDTVLAAAVAAQAALQVLQLLEGDTPASVGGTLELELPGWRWRRRSWPQHPDCDCAWAQAVA
ncbi:MAG: UBA/THIF-type binding protein [Frankiales bacterium]|nr:UBA/THIF-type binding protein [Frankiales bacterium]